MKKGVVKALKVIALILVIIGGLNWGLYGLFNFDVVAMLFGIGLAAQIVYVLVGVGALWLMIYYLFIKKHKK